MSETIERAAIMHRGKPYSVPRPGRHHDVFQKVLAVQFPDEAPYVGTQGFLTNAGRFVDRAEGAQIAAAAGQILPVGALRGRRVDPKHLFSEDVW